MDTRAWLAERLPSVERALEAALPAAGDPPQRLHAAMRHLLFPGGKRLRPALALAGAEAVGGVAEQALPAAVAVELVHAYSLIHDDLPCMDDDAERRGLPSVHVAFGEATAVLAGDALIPAAFAALVEGAGDAAAAQCLAAVRELAEAIGAAGLVGGQHDDLVGVEPDADAVESVHRRKSAALFAAAIGTGARLVGADAASLASLRRAGIAGGVAFQIADDLLDAEADEGCSLVRAIGPDAARARTRVLLARALGELAGFGDPAEPLRALLRFAVDRDA